MENIVTGTLKANGFFVGEVLCDFTGTKPPITANFALAHLVDGSVATLYGKAVKVDGWSQETMVRLKDLLTSIQRDLSEEVLDEGATRQANDAPSNLPIGEDGIPEL
jgi:hypothetical protein